MDPERPTEASLADKVAAVSRRVRRGWLEALEGISPHQARALRIVVQHSGIRLGVLAETLHVAPRSVTDVVDALESHGWVRRDPDPTDRRATVVVATDSGREMAAVADRARAEHADALFDVLTPTEKQTLSDLLDRILTDRPGEV